MIPAPVITLVQRGRSEELSAGRNDVELDEGPVMLTLQTPTCPAVALDDLPLSLVWRSREQVGALTFDLTNQVGFHRLRVRVGAQLFDFDFRTRTAKATWDEIRAMANVCGSSYLGYRRQFTYVAANGERRKVLLPQIHFAWLRDRLPEIGLIARAIAKRPAVSPVRQRVTSARSKGMSLPGTVRFLHEHPHLLEERADGPIAIGDKRYWPPLVMAHVSERHPAEQEHAEIAAFLLHLLSACQDLHEQIEPGLRPDVDAHISEVTSLLGLGPFADVRRRGKTKIAWTGAPTLIQRSDSRYARIRALKTEYFADMTDRAGYAQSFRANLKDVWEIYQTFVAHVIGHAMGLGYSTPAAELRARDAAGSSMRSGDWLMFFDAKLPANTLTSWRDHSGRPADERPDIALLSTKEQLSLVLDAKFKIDAVSSRATQRDLFEMQGYLNSYGTGRGGIIYPGDSMKANLIEARGNRILELPLRAAFFTDAGGVPAVHDYVRTALGTALAALPS